MSRSLLSTVFLFTFFAGEGSSVKDHYYFDPVALNFIDPLQTVIDVAISVGSSQDQFFSTGPFDNFVEP